jgi:hypothetical protein
MSASGATSLQGGGVWPLGVSRERMVAAVAAVEARTARDPVFPAAPPADRGIRDQTRALCASHGAKDTGASRCPEHFAAGPWGGSGGSGGPGDNSAAAITTQARAARSLLFGIDADPALAGLARAATVLATSLGAGWLLGWLTAAARVPDAAGADKAAARAYEIAVATALVALGLEPKTPDDTRATLQATEAIEKFNSAREAAGGTAAAALDGTIAALGRALRGDCRRWTPEEMATATVPGLLGSARALVRAGHAARAHAVFFVLAPTPPCRPLFQDADVWEGRSGRAPP